MPDLESKRIVEIEEEFIIVGLPMRTDRHDDFSEIWNDFLGRYDDFSSLADAEELYGVWYDLNVDTGAFDYIAGVRMDELPDDDGYEGRPPKPWVPEGADWVEVPARSYASFECTIEDYNETMDKVHYEWMPDAGYREENTIYDAPAFEKYPPGYEQNMDQEFEVYIPLQKTD